MSVWHASPPAVLISISLDSLDVKVSNLLMDGLHAWQRGGKEDLESFIGKSVNWF